MAFSTTVEAKASGNPKFPICLCQMPTGVEFLNILGGRAGCGLFSFKYLAWSGRNGSLGDIGSGADGCTMRSRVSEISRVFGISS